MIIFPTVTYSQMCSINIWKYNHTEITQFIKQGIFGSYKKIYTSGDYLGSHDTSVIYFIHCIGTTYLNQPTELDFLFNTEHDEVNKVITKFRETTYNDIVTLTKDITSLYGVHDSSFTLNYTTPTGEHDDIVLCWKPKILTDNCYFYFKITLPECYIDLIKIHE